MTDRMLADTLLATHLLFILFAVGGGLLVYRWPRIAWMHIPAALWAVLIALSGGICPLTLVENDLRWGAGMNGYPDGFIGTLLIPLIYPEGLTRPLQIALGLGVLLLNGAVYGLLILKRK